MQKTYANILDGKLKWGAFTDFTGDCDIVIDTRHEDEDSTHEIPSGPWEIHYFPIRPGMEPEDDDKWNAFGKEMMKELKAGKSILVLDSDGTERAPMLVWFFYTEYKGWHFNDCLEDIRAAYKSWPDRPQKWINLEVPRFARQLMWGSWKLDGISWFAFTRKYGNETLIRPKKGVQRMHGDVACGEIIHPHVSRSYGHLRRKGFRSIPIVNAGQAEDWSELHPQSLINIKYRFMHYNRSVSIQFAATFANLWYSFYVFKDRHLEPDGETPNEFFFAEQERISTSLTIEYEGRNPHIKPDYIWWFGELLPYDDAHVIVFSSLYATLIVETPKFKELVFLKEVGHNLLLLDYFTPDFKELGYTYDDYIQTRPIKWRTAYVLYGLLTNQKPWFSEDIARDCLC